jgi:hypothetical protein
MTRLALLCVAGCWLGGCGTAVNAVPKARPAVRISPVTPRDPSRISPTEAASIRSLERTSVHFPEHAEAHSHTGASVEVPLFNGDAATFANQWLAAQTATSQYDTLDKAAALGYVRASTPGSGIGTHWVKWSQIAKPFDPTAPAMLLFDEHRTLATLVGYSYWLQSINEPIGFAGGNDHWHQHRGLCVVNGWLDREEASAPTDCAGSFLAGGDLWMLHAWVVAGYENRNGKFATFNPKLCPPDAGTPDILRCPH